MSSTASTAGTATGTQSGNTEPKVKYNDILKVALGAFAGILWHNGMKTVMHLLSEGMGITFLDPLLTGMQWGVDGWIILCIAFSVLAEEKIKWFKRLATATAFGAILNLSGYVATPFVVKYQAVKAEAIAADPELKIAVEFKESHAKEQAVLFGDDKADVKLAQIAAQKKGEAADQTVAVLSTADAPETIQLMDELKTRQIEEVRRKLGMEHYHQLTYLEQISFLPWWWQIVVGGLLIYAFFEAIRMFYSGARAFFSGFDDKGNKLKWGERFIKSLQKVGATLILISILILLRENFLADSWRGYQEATTSQATPVLVEQRIAELEKERAAESRAWEARYQMLRAKHGVEARSSQRANPPAEVETEVKTTPSRLPRTEAVSDASVTHGRMVVGKDPLGNDVYATY